MCLNRAHLVWMKTSEKNKQRASHMCYATQRLHIQNIPPFSYVASVMNHNITCTRKHTHTLCYQPKKVNVHADQSCTFRCWSLAASVRHQWVGCSLYVHGGSWERKHGRRVGGSWNLRRSAIAVTGKWRRPGRRRHAFVRVVARVGGR